MCFSGSFLGLIAGTVSYGLLWMTGTSMKEIKYWQHEWKQKRDAPIMNEYQRLKYDDELLQSHMQKISQQGIMNVPDLDILDKNVTKST